MASIILRGVGTAVGNALLPGIGGAFLGALGSVAGASLNGALGLGTKIQGPQLANLSVQDSRYGAGIPVVYGEARIAGNVIWSTDLIQASQTQNVGGKGGGGETVTTYSYSVHCAVGICAGPIGSIDTIWADSNIIYQDGVWSPGVVSSATIYTGTTTQNPDAFMESMLGSGNVPANRGLAYIVLESLQLGGFGNRLPNLTFEVVPPPASSAPQWLGGVDAVLLMNQQTAQGSGMRPIPLDLGGSEVEEMLVGGYVTSGSSCTFEVVHYDVSGDTPGELARLQSASFTASNPVDHSWAPAPDGRYVAMYLQNGVSPTHQYVIYDSVGRQFGSVLTIDMGNSSSTKQVAWIDAQHIVLDHVESGVRGLRVLARAGLELIDLGFFGVWGASSSTARVPLFYAQYTLLAGGLLNYMTDVAGASFAAIYAVPLVWQNNNLVIGTPYTVASSLAPGTGSGPHANLIATGGGEWTLVYGTVVNYALMSFVPGLSSASITRPWQSFTPSFGLGTTTQPLYYGDRVVLVQRCAFDGFFRLSEILLGSGGFSLALDAAEVGNVTALVSYFTAARLDSSRLLLAGSGGFINDIAQLGIIQRCVTGDGLDAIVGDILTRAGYASGDYDVSALSGISVDGYLVQEPMTARAALQPLQAFQPFDLVESAAALNAVLHGGSPSVTIPAGEWRAGPDKKDPPPALEITRAQELDLPVEVDVDYIDSARNYEVNCQRARRIATQAVAVQKVTLPIVIEADAAKQIAETRLYTLWAEREMVKLRYSRRYLTTEPGDVIDLANGSFMRVTSVNQAGGLIEAQGFLTYSAAGTSGAAGDSGQTAAAASVTQPDSTLYLMDLPLLQSSDDQPGVYAAVTGLGGWTGASIWRAPDGVNYSDITGIASPAVSGIAATALANKPTYFMDNAGTVNVQLIQGELVSCDTADLLNGANAALLGGEIIQFQTATLMGPGLYTLSNLLRGRRATEWATASHMIGETFVLLTPGTVDFLPALLTDRGRTYEFRALSNGQSLNDAQDNDFTYNLITIEPFSPVHIAGSRASGAGSDLTVTWIRRARLNADWADYVDVPLDEPVELYDVDVMNGSSAIRTFSSLPSPTVTYTAAEQASDWGGGIPSSFTLNIYQISSRYGRGQAGSAVL
jgi:hypothetical protein